MISESGLPGMKAIEPHRGRKEPEDAGPVLKPLNSRPWCKGSDGVQAGGSWGEQGRAGPVEEVEETRD